MVFAFARETCALCAPREDGVKAAAPQIITAARILLIDMLAPYSRWLRPTGLALLDGFALSGSHSLRSFAAAHHGASVGGDNNWTRPSRPDDTSTLLFEPTIMPSTSGRRSMSAIPASGPRMNTPVESPSAIAALGARIVALRVPCAGSPVA